MRGFWENEYENSWRDYCEMILKQRFGALVNEYVIQQQDVDAMEQFFENIETDAPSMLDEPSFEYHTPGIYQYAEYTFLSCYMILYAFLNIMYLYANMYTCT